MEEIGTVDAKLGTCTKRRVQPPKHSYAYIRQTRKARRLRSSNSEGLTFSVESLNRQNGPNVVHLQPPTATHGDRLKLLNFLPAHMIIPPGTNVSVPPPPLPLFPPNIQLMRFPVRHLFLKPPPPLHLLQSPRLFNPYEPTMVDKTIPDSIQDGNSRSENQSRPKIQFPPPPLPLYPMALNRPPVSPPFMENLAAPPPSSAPQDFRIFAEHTIKAALGITPGSPVQVRNY